MLDFLKAGLINLSINHPKKVLLSGLLITLVFLTAFPFLKTDTDPVHMLPSDNPAVLLHNKVKKTFKVADVVALGIQTKNGESLFTPEGLLKIKLITDEVLQIEGVFEKIDLMSISTVDDIVKNDQGELLVTKLMNEPPKSLEASKEILKRINENPLIAGKLSSQKGDLVAVFMPLLEGKKDQSYKLSQKVKAIAEKHLGPNEVYHFAGLPVAESTFGNEMFLQMAVFAPMAGLVIFLLLLVFFRSWKVVVAPMILSMMAVIWSMGSLIMSGNVIHIMSSMIPIFIMPIAVLDSVHILSVLADRMGKGVSKIEALKQTVSELFNPMLYTTLTTIVGFASLAGTGIPPVVVFGVTIAFGVGVSFLLTIVFIPAYTVLLSDKALSKFGGAPSKNSPINIITGVFKRVSWQRSKIIILLAVGIIGVSLVGVQKITINDNPVRWFKPGHELRIADVEMNKALAGTYMTNLVFSFDEDKGEATESVVEDEFADFDAEEKVDLVSIKSPKVIAYMNKLSDFLKTVKTKDGELIVGGTTGVNDLVKKVGQVAFDSEIAPKTLDGISQYMFLFESGDVKKGKDLWKLMSPDAKEAQMWVHFKSGDNQNMNYTMKVLKDFMDKNPVPQITGEGGIQVPLKVEWAGLMHINSVWQSEMVRGMGEALMGSFVIVFFMMMFLFRSAKWAVVAMLPLSITIVFIYGAIGFSGKFYDMPIAVLSSLTLGLSIDFAIHFIEHVITYNKKLGSLEEVFDKMFAGTAQAIWRNVMVISIGFTPLFFAALQPYFTVGMFFFLIMLVSGVTTLLILPSILKTFNKTLLKRSE